MNYWNSRFQTALLIAILYQVSAHEPRTTGFGWFLMMIGMCILFTLWNWFIERKMEHDKETKTNQSS